MKTFLKGVGIMLLLVLVVIQFIRPKRSNPTSDSSQSIWSDRSLPTGVGLVLKRSCADCHSNTTQWPWYSEIAPMSWVVAQDVEEGRKHLNLSEWGSMPPEKRDHALEEIEEEVESGNMPPGKYTLLHGDAKLSAEDVAAITGWAESQRKGGRSEDDGSGRGRSGSGKSGRNDSGKETPESERED